MIVPGHGPSPSLHDINRRDFLRTSALAVGGVAVGACLNGSTGPPDEAARVAAVRGTDLSRMTRDVLEGVGGIERIVGEGETVFIKPNMVTLPWATEGDIFHGGECTKPEIVIAVAEECLRVGAAEVVIGDGSHLPTLNWQAATTLDGSTNLAREVERLSAQYPGSAAVASLETDSPDWVELPSRTYMGRIAVSSLVARADRVITIPVAKTHSWAQLTLSSKNFVGVTPMQRYGTRMEGGYWDRGRVLDHSTPRSIAAIYLDIVDGVNPDLAIIDFSIGIEGDGPNRGHGGRTVDMRERLGSWLLIASTDIMAADATAARIMSHDIGAITQLGLGYELGLGEIRQDRIEVAGERLADLQVEWAPAVLKNRLGLCPFSAPHFAARRTAHRWT
jgi:uncharacterized protein (DUF362 family)